MPTSHTESNAPAFPCEIVHSDYQRQPVTGLTKREYFAGLALQGAIACNALNSPQDCAHFAKLAADALLEALSDEKDAAK